MKIALYLFVVIAAFALIQESAAAGLLGGVGGLLGGVLGGVSKTVDTTLKGVGNIVSDTLGTQKVKETEAKKNVKSKEEVAKDKFKQQIQKLEKALPTLQNKVDDAVENVFDKLEGNWKALRAEIKKKVPEMMNKNLKNKSNSKLEDVKQGVSNNMKVLSTETAEKVKCDETEKAEVQNELYTNLESVASEWYKKAE